MAAIGRTLGRRHTRAQRLRLGRGPALVAFLRGVADALSVAQRAEALRLLDHGEVDKDVLADWADDEAESLAGVKPLDDPFDIVDFLRIHHHRTPVYWSRPRARE